MKQRTVTVDRKALVRLLNYVKADEQKNFQEVDIRRSRNRIFKSIQTLIDNERFDRPAEYLFVRLKVRDGEREYYIRTAFILGKKQTPARAAEQYARTFFGSKPTHEDDGYYFHGGEVYVCVHTWSSITREDFGVLSKYL